MDVNDFETLGECPFGTVWRVASEDKVVVNAYQAALYFSTFDFFHFANMINVGAQTLATHLQDSNMPPVAGPVETAPQKPATKAKAKTKVQEINAFRKKKNKKDEGDK